MLCCHCRFRVVKNNDFSGQNMFFALGKRFSLGSPIKKHCLSQTYFLFSLLCEEPVQYIPAVCFLIAANQSSGCLVPAGFSISDCTSRSCSTYFIYFTLLHASVAVYLYFTVIIFTIDSRGQYFVTYCFTQHFTSLLEYTLQLDRLFLIFFSSCCCLLPLALSGSSCSAQAGQPFLKVCLSLTLLSLLSWGIDMLMLEDRVCWLL